uniref:Abasic site processing protein n=1 Tax=Desulfovibrio sp. U5L TaxID=596152 RepID=I2Q312_9BACT
MCGRFALAVPRRLVAEAMGLPGMPDVPARPEIFPSELIEAVFVDRQAGRRMAGLFRWGFVPAFMKDPQAARPMINARAETVLDKPSFRAAARYRRCLIPAQGFFEWRKEPDGSKTRFFLTLPDAPVMALAGIYERATTPAGEARDTAAILTREASPAMAGIHDRMPLILPPHTFAAWLDPLLTERRDIAPLLAVPPPEQFNMETGGAPL